jgi:DNA-binding transcriptional ArsR family regulator
MTTHAGVVRLFRDDKDPRADVPTEFLDRVFFALSDPVRRAILERLGGAPRLVSELAAPFDISLQAVSRHIQVLVRAGLVRQERTGRINRCRLDVGPIFAAAVWINRYSKYWQEQFDVLAAALEEIEERRPLRRKAAARRRRRRGPSPRR